jgi:hypothetical protein
MAPKTTLGEALNTLREARIAHLPVTDDEELGGILSLYDAIKFTTRGGSKSQGGSSGDFGGGGRAAGEATAASAHVRAIPTVCSICRCGT